jgi:hypothetical protein
MVCHNTYSQNQGGEVPVIVPFSMLHRVRGSIAFLAWQFAVPVKCQRMANFQRAGRGSLDDVPPAEHRR